MFPRFYRVLSTAAVLMALVSCGGSGSSPDDTIPSSNVERAVAQLDELATEVFTRSGIPGMAVAVVHQGKTVYARGFGVRRLGEATPIDAQTVFQVASVSKSVGATVVAAQVGKGVVSWDTPVVQHLPWFSLHDATATAQVTIGDFFSHRSGLPEHAGDDLEELGHDRRQALERLHFLPTAPLRSRYAYTNFGLTAGAEAVAVASGTDWASLSDQALYGPLGMTATSSRFADFIARSNRAHPHIRLDGVFQPGVLRQPDTQSPAGGVSSNVLDMAAWMTMVLHDGKLGDREFIPHDALAPALSPQILSSPPPRPDAPTGYYGYGFNVSIPVSGNTLLSHSGAFLMGAGTSFSLLPAADTGIVVLTNALPVGAAEALNMMYMDLVRFGHVTEDWLALYAAAFTAMTAPTGELAGQPFPDHPAAALPAHAYIGTYASDYYGDAKVEQHGDQLALIMGPAAHVFHLQHWDGNVFVFEPGGEIASPGSRSAVTFAAGPGGMAQSLTIELYEKTGLGTLARR
ncbi:MAG: serine hydrolase [Pusillimonas sp.]